MKTELFAVIVCACIVISKALPFPDNGDFIPSETYINCNDLSLVEKLENAGIKFSCFQSASKNVLNSLPVDSSVNSINPSSNRESYVPDMEVVKVTECPEGYSFDSENSDCVLNESIPKNSQQENYFNPNMESLSSNKCDEGYIFNLDKGECLPDKKVFSVSYSKDIIPANADEKIIKTMRCRSGTIYSPEVDLCLPIKAEAIAQEPEVESLEIAFIPHPTKGCPKGSVYNPSIDHCLKIQGPPRKSTPVVEFESLLTSNNGPSVVYDSTSSKHEKRSATNPKFSVRPLSKDGNIHNCTEGEVYVSEIDMCLKP